MDEHNTLPLSYRPAVWFFRDSIERSTTVEGLKQISRALCEELEARNAQIREMGSIPQRVYEPSAIGPDGEVIEDERQLKLRLG